MFSRPCSVKFYVVDVNIVPATLVTRAGVTVGFLELLQPPFFSLPDYSSHVIQRSSLVRSPLNIVQ